jgi:hypothetical protein
MANEKNLKRDAGPGRPKGCPNKIPGSVKASVKAVLAEVAEANREEIKTAIVKGINSRPPHSLRYIEVVAHYTDGKPKDTVEVKTPRGRLIQVVLSGQPTPPDTSTDGNA